MDKVIESVTVHIAEPPRELDALERYIQDIDSLPEMEAGNSDYESAPGLIRLCHHRLPPEGSELILERVMENKIERILHKDVVPRYATGYVVLPFGSKSNISFARVRYYGKWPEDLQVQVEDFRPPAKAYREFKEEKLD